MALNDKLDQMDLTDIFRAFHPQAEYRFFSRAHGTFSRIDHLSAHKTSLNKFTVKSYEATFLTTKIGN